MNRQVIRLTEDDLHQIVENTVARVIMENQEDEGFWGGLKGAYNGVKNAVSGEYNKFKNGVMNNGLNNEYGGQSFGDRMRGGMDYVKKSAANGSQSQDLQGFMKQLDGMISSGRLGQKGTQAAQNLKGILINTMRGGNGRLQQAYNRQF